jgi:DNA (cytosine-5)-methyltransferase 1
MRLLIVDNFAGGGGASTGIEMAIGRSVDIAINHDEMAIKMHQVNHPDTKHYIEDVWQVDPIEATQGQPVGLAWFSPDCKHFSKAKGGKPVDKNVRGLAWVAVKWAKAVHPRVIILENVEEFQTWGPLIKDEKGDLYPDPNKKGQTFELFIKALEKQGYKVAFRELRACDYGAPTSRKRFFMIARCDGKQIVWPEPSHGDPEGIEVRCGLLKPWRTAAECIDWSIPCPSIFDRKKPLAENTLKRIAKGIQKFVIDNPEPFIIQYHSYGEGFRGQELGKPIMTLDTSNRYGLVTPFLTKYFGGYYEGCGNGIDEPVSTLTTKDRLGLVTSHLIQMNNNCDGRDLNKPMNTIVAGPGHIGEVRTFLMTYYGNGNDLGQRLDQPLRTITAKDRFGIVTVKGIEYQIVDIGMRMLKPHELFKAQGFPDNYIIDRDSEGNLYPTTEQVAKCGNSVCPPLAKALVEANYKEEIFENVAG